MNGWICYPANRTAMWVMVILLLLAASLLYWRLQQPTTEKEMFEVRCSSCHELQLKTLCGFAPQLRPEIVDVMRRYHGADAVINESESMMIRHYLEGEQLCQ